MKGLVSGHKAVGSIALLVFPEIILFRVFSSSEGIKVSRFFYEIRELLGFNFAVNRPVRRVGTYS